MQSVSTNKYFSMNLYLSVVIIAVLFVSCNKEPSDEFYVDPNNPVNDTAWRDNVLPDAPVNKIFQLFTPSTQTDSFDVQRKHKLLFNDYLQITFPGNSLEGEGGEKITGVAKIKIDYLETKGDLIRFRRSTTSGDKLLESGGVFNIEVTQNGQQLKIAANNFIMIRYRSANPDPNMGVFYGDTTASNIDNFNWLPASDSKVNIWSDSGYQLFPKRFNWINCDKFVNTTNSTTVFATLPVNFTNNNTAVYVVFRDMFSVVRMYPDVDNRLFYFNNLPLSNVTIVSISKIGDNLYLGTKQTTVTENLIVKLSPEKKTEKEITDYINSL